MAKYSGTIGYVITRETSPGIWEEEAVERKYYGDILRNSRRIENSGQVNDNVNISNQISILSDPFANDHIYAMRYATYMGHKWRVTDVEVAYPRLNLTLGGLYNGEA